MRVDESECSSRPPDTLTSESPPFGVTSMAPDARRKRPMSNGASLMLSIFAFASPFLISSATPSRAGTSYCGPAFEFAAVQQRWAAARQSRVDPGHNEKNCRAYGIHFYQAAMARQ